MLSQNISWVTFFDTECINVTHYSKRYLRALATSYWLGIPFSHKRTTVFSSQEVQYRM